MNLPNIIFDERLFLLSESLHKIKRVFMVNGFEMVLERFSSNGDAISNNNGCFISGERVAFNGVGRKHDLHVIPSRKELLNSLPSGDAEPPAVVFSVQCRSKYPFRQA